MTSFSRRTFGVGAAVLATSAFASPPAASRAAADPVPVPASGAYFGAYNYVGNDNGVSAPEALESIAGRQFAINHCFHHWDRAFAIEHRARVQRDVDAGRIPMISWSAGDEARLTQIGSGALDGWIDGQVSDLGAFDAPILLRFTWEFDLRYDDTALFKKAWQRVRGRFRTGAPKVAFVWCPTWRAYRETMKADPFYPDDADVDWIGADGYARPNAEKEEYDYRAFDLMFDAAHAFAVAHGKPFIVGETGVNRAEVDPVQAPWLTATRAAIKDRYPSLKAFVYFHRDGADPDEHWRIVDGGAAQTAFAEMANDPRFTS